MNIYPCGSCLTAEFADDDSEDEEIMFVQPGKSAGHLRRPSGSMARGVYGQLARTGTYTYCGRPIGDDWKREDRWPSKAAVR